MQRLRLADDGFSLHRGFHASPCLRFSTRTRGHGFPVSRAGRFAGYALIAGAALIAGVARREAIATIGPFPVIAVVLLFAMIGAMLVFTDLMVRGLYAQIDAVKGREEEEAE